MAYNDQPKDLTDTKTSGVHPDFLTSSCKTWQKIGDVMHKDVLTISVDESALVASRMMSSHNISCIVVTDNEKVAGIVTERDFMGKAASRGRNLKKAKVSEIMSWAVESVPSSLSVIETCRNMEEKHIRHLPVIDNGKLVGIVTQRDLVQAITSYYMWRNVVNIMSRDIAEIEKRSSVKEAVEIMNSRHLSCLVVMDKSGPVGIITERDIFKKIVALQKDPGRVKVEKTMSSPIISVPIDCSVFNAGKTMENKHVRRLIVMDADRICGIVTQTDIFRAVKRRAQEEEEKTFQSLQEATNCIFSVNLEGITTYVNPAFMKLLEVEDAGIIVGQPFLPEQFWNKPAERELFKSDLQKEYPVIRELALKTYTGNQLYVTVFSTFTKNIQNEISGIQGVLYDITAKKELVTLRKTEEALRESQKQLSEQNNQLEQTVRQRTADVIKARDITVLALAKLTESRDQGTGEHLERLCLYSQILARQLATDSYYTDEIDERFIEDIYRASPLHDIGKVGVPDAILLKPDCLTVNEFDTMKEHTIIGAETLESAAKHDNSDGFLVMAASIARSHHERFDGSGYPEGLKGQEIPLAARITALADVYDALTSTRIYRSALQPEVARNMIEEQTGKHFDPVIVEAFRACWEELLTVPSMFDNSKSDLMQSCLSSDIRR